MSLGRPRHPGGSRAWLKTSDGRLPAVLGTMPVPGGPIAGGERVWLWCRARLSARDLTAACDTLRRAGWASDARVLLNDRHDHIVVFEVIRRAPARRPAEPVSYAGLGLYRPFG